jgi:hypothetical protein
VSSRERNQLRSLARAIPPRVQPGGDPGVYVGQIVDDGARPGWSPAVYATRPATVSFVEEEGATVTITPSPDTAARVLVGSVARVSRGVGGTVIATLVSGRWVTDTSEYRCPSSLYVRAMCGGGVNGATVNVRDGSNVLVATGTTADGQGTTGVFAADLSPATYSVEVIKTGWLGWTGSVTIEECRQVWIHPIIMPSGPVNFPVQCVAGPDDDYGIRWLCPVEGAVVTVTGDGTGSGTTGPDGRVTVVLDVPTPKAMLSLTITANPPPGCHGMKQAILNVTQHPCAGGAVIPLLPDDDHTLMFCGGKYAPASVDYSDDKGSCTAVADTRPVGHWAGYRGDYRGVLYLGRYDYTARPSRGLDAYGNCVEIESRTGPITVQVFLTKVYVNPRRHECENVLSLKTYTHYDVTRVGNNPPKIVYVPDPYEGPCGWSPLSFTNSGPTHARFIDFNCSSSEAIGPFEYEVFAVNIDYQLVTMTATVSGSFC